MMNKEGGYGFVGVIAEKSNRKQSMAMSNIERTTKSLSMVNTVCVKLVNEIIIERFGCTFGTSLGRVLAGW